MSSKLLTPKESTAVFLKKTFGIVYPWRFKDTLPAPRLTEDELLFRALNKRKNADKDGFIAKMVIRFLLKPLARNSAMQRGYRFMQKNFGPEYYPDEFLQGVYLIAKPAIESLSYFPSQPTAFEKCTSFYTQPMIDRFRNEFERLRNLKDIGIEIAVSNIYDANIKREWLMLGPEVLTKEIRTSPHYKVQYFLGEGRTVAKLPHISTDLLALKPMPGVKIHIDVELLLDTSMTVYQLASESLSNSPNPPTESRVKEEAVLESTPIYHEFTERRNVILRISSPWFKSVKEMVQVSEDEDGNPIHTWDWNWKVGDIDYLLEAEKTGCE